jgi:hypothetical protein
MMISLWKGDGRFLLHGTVAARKKGRAPWEFYFTFDLLLLWRLTLNCSVYTPFSRGKRLVTYCRFLGVHYRIDCS